MAKGIMYINGQRVAFDGEKNVLAVIRKAGINMPTLCYYSDLSVYGACRRHGSGTGDRQRAHGICQLLRKNLV